MRQDVAECLVNGPALFEHESLGALASPFLEVWILSGGDAALSLLLANISIRSG